MLSSQEVWMDSEVWTFLDAQGPKGESAWDWASFSSTDRRSRRSRIFHSACAGREPRTVSTGAVLDSSWIFQILSSTDADGEKPLKPTLKGVNALIASANFAFLDRLLISLPLKNMNRFVMLGLARSSNPVRSKLSNWRTFILRARDELEARNLDSARLLQGLI